MQWIDATGDAYSANSVVTASQRPDFETCDYGSDRSAVLECMNPGGGSSQEHLQEQHDTTQEHLEENRGWYVFDIASAGSIPGVVGLYRWLRGLQPTLSQRQIRGTAGRMGLNLEDLSRAASVPDRGGLTAAGSRQSTAETRQSSGKRFSTSAGESKRDQPLRPDHCGGHLDESWLRYN